ncbi:MAG: cyclic nucleotide-binding domain-containing protein [Spirochaetota bacterium]
MPISLEKLFLSLIPLPIVYVLYRKHLTAGNIGKFFLEALLSGILLGSLIVLLSSFTNELFPTKNKILIGFVHAAVLEKGGAFLLILLLVPLIKAGNRLIDAVSFGMFFGLGFSMLENIFYAMQIKSATVLLVRTFSAVPIHVSTCGIIAYFLALSRFSKYRFDKSIFFLVALFFPIVLHGIYDTSLLLGKKYTYLIGPELVFLIFVLEYLTAHSLSFPDHDELRIRNMGLEDWQTTKKQAEYDRWILKSMGKRNEEYVPFFKFHITRFQWLLIFFFVSISLTSLFFQNDITRYFNIPLKTEEKFTLFVLFPAILSFSTVLIGSINSLYFENSIIRIPIISDVQIFENSQDTQVSQVTCMDISATNCFLKTLEPIGKDKEFQFSFRYTSRESPLIKGAVLWENHEDLLMPIGSIVRFTSSARGFKRFIFGYYLFKLWKGLQFNLRLPGFYKIRKFFVKVNTVMEDYNSYAEGTIIYKQGEPGEHFYLLRKGKVEEYRVNESGERFLVNEVYPGEVFGEMSVVTGRSRRTSAECAEDSVIAIADANNLEALFESNPGMSYRLVNSLSHRIQAMEEHLYEQPASQNNAETFYQERWEKANQALDTILNPNAKWLLLGPEGCIQNISANFLKLTLYSRTKLIGQELEFLFGENFEPYPGEQSVELFRKNTRKAIPLQVHISDVSTDVAYLLLIKVVK